MGSHRSDEYVLVALKLEGKEAEERKRREKEEEERRIKEKLDIEFGQKLAGAMAKAFDHLLLIYGDLVCFSFLFLFLFLFLRMILNVSFIFPSKTTTTTNRSES